MANHSATDADAKQAINAFSIRGASVLRPSGTSEHHDDFLVEGEGSKRFLMRCYAHHSKPVRIGFELAFQQALLGLGFPTPFLKETTDGNLMHENEVGIWALHEFIQGEPYVQSPGGRVEEMGKRLAQFHVLAEQIDIPETDTAGGSDLAIRSWWESAQMQLDEVQEILSDLPVASEIDQLRAWVTDVLKKRSVSLVGQLPFGWCHGDPSGLNMIFDGDNLVALLDFEVVHRGQLVEDVSNAAFLTAQSAIGANEIRPEILRRFVSEYHLHRPLTTAEIDMLPEVLLTMRVPKGTYYRVLQRRNVDLAVKFRSDFARFQSLVPQVEVARHAIADLDRN